jgi:hypothetical protein
MPSRARDVRSYLFTVRVWPEELGDGRVEWRGRVQYVSSGETLLFRDWNSLVTFLLGTFDPAQLFAQQPPESPAGSVDKSLEV